MTSASHYVMAASRYQSRSSMYIGSLIPQISMELAEAVMIKSKLLQIHRRSYKSDHVLLNLLYNFKTRDKMGGLNAFYLFFETSLIN